MLVARRLERLFLLLLPGLVALAVSAQTLPTTTISEVHYRGLGALARVTNPASIAAQRRGIDDGLHGAVRHLKEPPARTSADCELAALALMDDTTGLAWTGEYDVWSDFLPGNAGDIFPGDALNVTVPSRGAAFPAIVREVETTIRNLEGETLQIQDQVRERRRQGFGI